MVGRTHATVAVQDERASATPRPSFPAPRQVDRPLRVAAFTTSYPQHATDPAGRFVLNTVEHLRARGVEVDVVGPGTYRDYGLTGSNGGGLVASLKRRPWLALWLALSMISDAAQGGQAGRPRACELACRRRGRPLRRPARSSSRLHGSGTAGRFSDLALADRAPRLVRLLLGRARAVMCCSEQLAAAMRGCGLENVHAIPYGVEIPDELGTEDDPATVLFAGRLSPEKNIDVIAEATEGLPRIIAGDGPLRALVPDALGFVSHQELAALYKRAAVVVLASSAKGSRTSCSKRWRTGRPSSQRPSAASRP